MPCMPFRLLMVKSLSCHIPICGQLVRSCTDNVIAILHLIITVNFGLQTIMFGKTRNLYVQQVTQNRLSSHMY